MSETVVAAPHPTPTPELKAVAERFIALMRTFNRARTRMLAAAAHDVEWSGHVVLKCIETAGSMRAGALAECLQSDPSTVSRQVASLVKDGLLERQADPADGRASLLVLTPKARTVIAEQDEIRLQYFADMLADWTQGDLRQFGDLLERFTVAYDSANDEWIARKLAARYAQPREESR